MTLVLSAIGLLLAGGLVALFLGKWPKAAAWVGAGSSLAAAALALEPVVSALRGTALPVVSYPWLEMNGEPFAELKLGLDALSAWFAIPVLLLPALAALFAVDYTEKYHGKKFVGHLWFFYHLMVASMLVVLLARNSVLFLLAWEVMSLASFFLVIYEDERHEAREAGWTYLVATHLGAAFLLTFFALWSVESGSVDFLAPGRTLSVGMAGLLFVLAVIGFGAKAGFVPFHVWLPEAYPVAPGFVPAVLSGAMSKLGIYGIVRVILLLVGSLPTGEGQATLPPAWWAWFLIILGSVSSVGGILLALAQADLKRFLAYSSVENLGIIALGLGVGLMGLNLGSALVATLGFAGALLHVWNHALFKGLLFLGAAAVERGAGIVEINELGGLLKRMKWTGTTFAVGSLAICGLPPLNGFLSEFLIYVAAFQEEVRSGPGAALAALLILGGLALVGGLAAAGFTRAFGMAFLGEPRGEAAESAKEVSTIMVAPMFVLALGCGLVGFLGSELVMLLSGLVQPITHLPATVVQTELLRGAEYLTTVIWMSVLLLVLLGGLVGLRWWLLKDRTVGSTVTWDCGFAAPTPRMQYTASSFAQPITAMFAPLLRPKVTLEPIQELFPADRDFGTETPDVVTESVYRPIFNGLAWGLGRMRWLQHGQVNLYVMYIALTLVILWVGFLAGIIQ